jgi:hypothetical protein
LKKRIEEKYKDGKWRKKRMVMVNKIKTIDKENERVGKTEKNRG